MNEIIPITKPTLTEAGVPTDAGGSLTTWIYFPNGQLQQKQDDAGKGATYTYTDAGRLKTRTWERAISATCLGSVPALKHFVLLADPERG